MFLASSAGSLGQTFPAITAAPSLDDPDSAIAAKTQCTKAKSWRITLKAGELLTLELFSCSEGTLELFKNEDFDGWPYPHKHQVLLLEKSQNKHIEILAAYYSELEFLRVETGHLKATNSDAVIWTANVKCGSCLRGPEGILVWNTSGKRYEWNEEWLASKPQREMLESALPVGYYLGDAESLHWTKNRTSVYIQSAVFSPNDAHCCPSGGGVFASINVQQAKLTLSRVRYQKPKRR
jgi:hypothetical protein